MEFIVIIEDGEMAPVARVDGGEGLLERIVEPHRQHLRARSHPSRRRRLAVLTPREEGESTGMRRILEDAPLSEDAHDVLAHDVGVVALAGRRPHVVRHQRKRQPLALQVTSSGRDRSRRRKSEAVLCELQPLEGGE